MLSHTHNNIEHSLFPQRRGSTDIVKELMVRFSVQVLYINKNSDDTVEILAKPFLPLSCDGCLSDLTGVEIFYT